MPFAANWIEREEDLLLGEWIAMCRFNLLEKMNGHFKRCARACIYYITQHKHKKELNLQR